MYPRFQNRFGRPFHPSTWIDLYGDSIKEGNFHLPDVAPGCSKPLIINNLNNCVKIPALCLMNYWAGLAGGCILPPPDLPPSSLILGNENLTCQKLRTLLNYDPLTGIFRWRIRVAKNVKAGAIAGTINNQGYRRIRIKGKLYSAHRLAWLYLHGEWPSFQLGHQNGNKDDNSSYNISRSDPVHNGRNRKISSDNSSGVTGVFWSKKGKKWFASIGVHGQLIHGGSFDKIEDAVIRRKELEREYNFSPNHGRIN